MAATAARQANYYQLTSAPAKRLPLRSAPVPGSRYVPMPDPGFRWNVLDSGKGNIFAAPLGSGKRCAKSHAAWHCAAACSDKTSWR